MNQWDSPRFSWILHVDQRLWHGLTRLSDSQSRSQPAAMAADRLLGVSNLEGEKTLSWSFLEKKKNGWKAICSQQKNLFQSLSQWSSSLFQHFSPRAPCPNRPLCAVLSSAVRADGGNAKNTSCGFRNAFMCSAYSNVTPGKVTGCRLCSAEISHGTHE